MPTYSYQSKVKYFGTWNFSAIINKIVVVLTVS